MSYEGVIEVIARLHVDIDFRARFRRDPGGALAGLALDERERRRLWEGLGGAEVDRIAALADYHRMVRVQEHVSWFDPARRPGLVDVFRSFARAERPRLLNRDEAAAFCRHVESLPAGEPGWLGELARYERAQLELAWSERGERTRVERFRYPILEIVGALGRGAEAWPAAKPLERPLALEFKKVPGVPAVIVRPLDGR